MFPQLTPDGRSRRERTETTGRTRSTVVYKIFLAPEAAALVETGRFEGSADDRRDGFIHLSTGDQVPGTLMRHFRDKPMLYLGYCPVSRLVDALRMEPSRNGSLFPHLYRALAVADLAAIVPIPDEREGWQPPALGSST